MLKTLAVAALAVAMPSLAAAQPSLTPPSTEISVASEEKSESTAVSLSVAGTLLPIALFATAAAADDSANGEVDDVLVIGGLAAAVVGPSAGHWYAGRTITGGMVARAAGGTALFLGIGVALGDAFDHDDDEGGDGDGALAAGLMFGGMAAVVGGVIHDIATADDAARAYNQHHARRFTVTPTVVRGAAATGAGLAVTGAF